MQKNTALSPWRVIRERKWIIVLAIVVAGLSAGALSFRHAPLYRSTAVMVQEDTGLDQTVLNSTIIDVPDVQRDLVTAAGAVTSPRVASLVQKQLRSPKSAGMLLLMVSAKPSTAANSITVTAVSSDAKEAADVANAFVNQTILQMQQDARTGILNDLQPLEAQVAAMTPTQLASATGKSLQTQVEELQLLEQLQTGGYILWQPATVSGAAFSPRPKRDTAVGLALGLILGLIFAFALDRLDRRIRREADFELEFALPVLASVPRLGRWQSRNRANTKGFVGFQDPRSPLLESFRSLRSNLQYFELDKGLKTLLVVSGLPQEGKTVTSINLALSLALSGEKVVLVDADLRNPLMHTYLDLNNDRGLSTVLAGGSPVGAALQVVKLEKFLPPNGNVANVAKSHRSAESLQKDLLCMTTGPLPPNPAELLASAKMGEVLASLADSADYVLLDSPPLLLVADVLSLASRVDGVIVVARANSTTSEEAREIRQQLDRIGARLIGVVVGGVKPNKSYRYRYGRYSTIDEPVA